MGTRMRPQALHGRKRETDALRAVLDAASGGRGQIALIEGEPGIGKTRLVTEVLDYARDTGCATFVGRAEEVERNRPFGALAEALECRADAADPRRVEIARLLAGAESDDRGPISVTFDPGLQYRAINLFAELVESEALRQPIAICIEDLHWSDPTTLAAARELLRRITYLPVALLGTFRPNPMGRELKSLVEAASAEGALTVRLSPLDEDAVVALASDSLGVGPGPRLRDQLSSAAGNPFYVDELLRAIVQEGLIRVSKEEAEIEGPAFPPTLRLTILRSLAFVPEGTLDALRFASVLGSRFSFADLCVTTGRDAGSLWPDLRDALSTGILGEDGDLLSFRHDLVRDAIYEDMPENVRAALHREAGRRLAASSAPALQVAEHFAYSASKGDTEAVDWIVRAARDAARTAPAVAVGLFDRALELVGGSYGGRDELIVDRAVSLLWSGRVAEAEAACLEALERPHRPDLDAPLRTLLAQLGLSQGRVTKAVREIEVGLAGKSLTAPDRARLQAWQAHCRMLLGDLEGALEAAEAAARFAPDDLTSAIALCCAATTRQMRGEFEQAVEIAAEAVRVADNSPDRSAHRFQVGVFQGFALIDVDRLSDAMAALRRGRAISEEIGAPWNLPLYRIILILGHYLLGQWDDAIAEFEASAAPESETRHGVILNNATRALIALHRDDLEGAERFVLAAEEEFSSTGPQFRVDCMMWARALLLEAAGALDEARATLSTAWDLCAGVGVVNELPVLAPDLVRLSVDGASRELAERATARVEELAAREPVAWVAGAALRCRGLLDDEPRTLAAAAEAYRRASRALDTAAACEDAATAFHRHGRPDEARPLLDEALDVYERLGAERDVARVGAILRGWGVHRGARGRRARPKLGWAALTDTELKVARLVSEGKSNTEIARRLYISPRTVNAHMSHILAKLGVSSRVELATTALAAQRSTS